MNLICVGITRDSKRVFGKYRTFCLSVAGLHV